MKKGLSALVISITLVLFSLPKPGLGINEPLQDSNELRLQDMLMLMLTPYIEKDLNSYYYPKILRDFSPHVTPWKVEVIETKRVNGFRGFNCKLHLKLNRQMAVSISL